ncbi:hypothetical protein [Actinomadura miaoliensis]
MAKTVASGKYPPDLGPLRVQVSLMNDRESVGVEAVRMCQVKALMDRQIADGHGEREFSSLFELPAKKG